MSSAPGGAPVCALPDAIPFFLQQRPTLRAGPVVLAVSGGLDSVVLAHLAAEAGLADRAVLAHFHHGLRGADADADQVFCEALANKLGMPLATARGAVALEASRGGVSTEAAARAARYSFLMGVARDYGAGAVFLAHHAGDQIETVLLNLTRGAGVTGWAGMPPVRGREPVWGRPLLACRRAGIEAYAAANGLRWREDRSNADTRLRRNWIRQLVVPALEEASSEWPQRILHLATLAQRFRAWLRPLVEACFAEAQGGAWADPTGPRGVSLSLAVLLDAPLPLREEVLREAFRCAACQAGTAYPPALCRVHTEALSALLARGRTGARIDLPLGISAHRLRRRLVFSPRS